MSAMWPLQTAVHARLTATAGVTALVSTRIYDGDAPQGAEMPYVVIGEGTEGDTSTFDRRGFPVTLTLHIWSNYAGRKEALDILDAMDSALRSPLTITSHTLARMRREFAEVLVEEDGIRHVPVRFRAYAMETA